MRKLLLVVVILLVSGCGGAARRQVRDYGPTVAPTWGERGGESEPFGPCSWCTQKGQWHCPAGYDLRRADGKPVRLRDRYGEGIVQPKLVCVKK